MTTRPDQLRILIDGNIIDALATDSQTLKLLQSLRARGAVEVLITFVQVTELNNTRGEDRRQQLLTTLAVLGPTKVATAGIWDCTNWDESKWVGEENEGPTRRGDGKQAPYVEQMGRRTHNYCRRRELRRCCQ